MIEVRTHSGGREYLHPSAIARITVAAASSQWHGIRSIVRTFDGDVIESTDDADYLLGLLAIAPVPSVPDGVLEPLYKIIDYADESDGACYGTLSASLVRDLARQAINMVQERS